MFKEYKTQVILLILIIGNGVFFYFYWLSPQTELSFEKRKEYIAEKYSSDITPAYRLSNTDLSTEEVEELDTQFLSEIVKGGEGKRTDKRWQKTYIDYTRNLVLLNLVWVASPA